MYVIEPAGHAAQEPLKTFPGAHRGFGLLGSSPRKSWGLPEGAGWAAARTGDIPHAPAPRKKNGVLGPPANSLTESIKFARLNQPWTK